MSAALQSRLAIRQLRPDRGFPGATLGVLALLLGSSAAPSLAQSDEPVRSPRNANYTIEVELLPGERMLHGRQTMVWRNIQRQPTRELWFHLYWNAWRNTRSTWMVEDSIRGRSSNRQPEDGDWSYLEIDSARLLADPGWQETDLHPSLRFVSPDDENRHDRTVAVLTLPRPVEPGETIRVEMNWRAKIPRTFARTGFRGDFYFIAHWFPKLGVFEGDDWNCHQYHSATEYFSDYGVYDVSITLPDDYVVGATGRRTELTTNGDGTASHRFQQADVHAFTWTASPDFRTATDRLEVDDLPPVDITLLYQPEQCPPGGSAPACHQSRPRAVRPLVRPLPLRTRHRGRSRLGAGAGGMEYPTLFTAGTRWLNPFGGGSPEGVTIHEAGHQFWYGVVGNNEFEHAWIDEGFNSFSDARVYDVTYGPEHYVKRYFSPPGTNLRGFLPLLFEDLLQGRDVWGNRMSRFRDHATTEVMSHPTFRYFPSKAGHLSYTKTALWLSTLERYLGWETLQPIMATFYERFSFAHPTPGDFFSTVDEVSGRDMTWFFDRVYRSSSHFDYAIESVKSRPLELRGLEETPAGPATRQHVSAAYGESRTYRSEIVVRREGDAIFPVDVLLVFDDGSEMRRSWDGKRRWTMLVEERPAKLAYAVVDPDRILLLDIDRTNNSRTLTPGDDFVATKLASRWIVWLQDFLLTFTFFS